MKFRLSRQEMPEEMHPILKREIKKQSLLISRASDKTLQALASVCEEINERGLPAHLVCKNLPENMGSGIFLHPTAEPILRGQLIGPYAGMVSLVPQNESDESSYAFAPIEKMQLNLKEQKFFDPKRYFHPRRNYSLMVDAEKKGNFTRYINHSEEPNVVAHLLRIPKNAYGLTPVPIEVVYFAKKKILPGQQLLVSYEDGEKSYWSVLKIKPVPVTPSTFYLDPELNLKKNSS